MTKLIFAPRWTKLAKLDNNDKLHLFTKHICSKNNCFDIAILNYFHDI